MFWLYEWLDENGISDTRRAERYLRDPVEVERLRQRAEAVPYTLEPLETGRETVLLGGRGIDLSGDLDCFAWDCRKKQVDLLFSRIWHYFDRVVVVGPSAFRVAKDLEERDVDWRTARLLSDIQLLLYLREIGAEDVVVFRQKPPPCEVHLRDHAAEAGLIEALDNLEALSEQFGSEARIELEPHGDHVHYSFSHPRFEHTVWGTLEGEGLDLSRPATGVARSVLGRYLSHLTSDVRSARLLGLPLGSTVQVHGDLLGLTTRVPSPAEVMLELELPILTAIDAKSVLEVRRAEREHFDKFRDSLTAAVTQRLRAERTASADAESIAREVELEIIRPALNDLSVRLTTARDALRRKKNLAIGLGSFLTACGVFTAQPLLIAAGLATAAPTLQAASKYIDDEREAKLSDMYFLWRALEHVHA